MQLQLMTSGDVNAVLHGKEKGIVSLAVLVGGGKWREELIGGQVRANPIQRRQGFDGSGARRWASSRHRAQQTLQERQFRRLSTINEIISYKSGRSGAIRYATYVLEDVLQSLAQGFNIVGKELTELIELGHFACHPSRGAHFSLCSLLAMIVQGGGEVDKVVPNVVFGPVPIGSRHWEEAGVHSYVGLAQVEPRDFVLMKERNAL